MGKAVGANNGNFKAYWRRDSAVSDGMTEREKTLEFIKVSLGAEEFYRWYDAVYAFRKQGKQAEYEREIFAAAALLAALDEPRDERYPASPNYLAAWDEFSRDTAATLESVRPGL